MTLSARRLETLLIRAIRGNRSPAQPSNESISFCRLKLPAGESPSIGVATGDRGFEEIMLRMNGSSPEDKLDNTSRYNHVLYKNLMNGVADLFSATNLRSCCSRIFVAPRTCIRPSNVGSSQTYKISAIKGETYLGKT